VLTTIERLTNLRVDAGTCARVLREALAPGAKLKFTYHESQQALDCLVDIKNIIEGSIENLQSWADKDDE